MIVKLKSLREESGGCPTSYSGETTNGEYFEAHLRHGYMRISVGGTNIVSCNPKGMDGVCSFSDFQYYASMNGIQIDNSDASFSSHYEDMDKLVHELYKDRVWVKFVVEFESSVKTFEKDKSYRVPIELAEKLRDVGLAFIDDDSYERKKKELEQEKNETKE